MNYPKVPKDILPTLIIGLGGTGYQVIKRLKELFNKRYNNDKLPIRYLLIDTDLKSFLDDKIKNNEKCQLRFGDGIKNTLDWAYNNPNFDWLPQNPKITPDFFTSTDQGAGLVRPIGRLYYCKNAKLAYDNLQTAKNDLVDLHKVLIESDESYLENIDRHKVYIVGSLAGGTGCGTFLDVAVMISKIFNRDNTNIIGMFTLESCYDDKLSSDLDAQNRSKANCYAALKELEFYMSSISNPDDKKYTFKYSNVGEIKLDRKLLDICYLIENKNELGGVLTNIEDIYDLCSLQLFQEVGTTLGSQLRADYANFICKDKDPILKKDRHFSTFASSSMEFPAENLKKYCSYRLSKDILNKLSSELNADDEVLSEEINSLKNKINSKLEIDKICEEFTSRLKVLSSIKRNELIEKKNNMNRAENMAKERESSWREIKRCANEDIDKTLNTYINEATVSYGIKFATRVLDGVKSSFSEDLEEINISGIDRSAVEVEFSNLSSNKSSRFAKKNKDEAAPTSAVNSFNKYIELTQNRLRKIVYTDRLELLKDNIKAINDRLEILVSHTGDMRNEIDILLSKINQQSRKKYGGNVVSREMISKRFYDDYYNKTFTSNFNNRIIAMFKDKNLIEVIENGSQQLIKLCVEEYERVGSNINIIDVLKENAKNRNMRFNDYIKTELNIASKLAKPFWTAIKNPEVAWTECYYIGCIKDENMNNGFTVKAPDAIDNWIRNQTGERSRWARYVETTNPYAIDVIHITMGACAAYLPDVKHYKQFYLNLLSSETYPLHLHQDYIGLEELDKETEDMLLSYTLARVYGAIIEIDNCPYLNIRKRDNEFSYIYSSKFCLKHQNYNIENRYMPESKTLIFGDVKKLGDSYHETIKIISEDVEIKETLRDFIKDTESKFKKEDLKEHYKSYYLNDKLSDDSSIDFIAKQKIINRVISD